MRRVCGALRPQRIAEIILSKAPAAHATAGIEGREAFRTLVELAALATDLNNIQLASSRNFPLIYVWVMPISSITELRTKELNLNAEPQLDPVCK